MLARYLSIITLLTLALPTTLNAQIPPIDENTCALHTNFELARAHRLYRARQFGKVIAEDAERMTVRFDREENAWIKTDENEWRSSAEGFENTTWSDLLMDSEDEHSTFLPIKGIFQTKGRRTSELIPYLLINLRAFQCKSEEICEIVRFSVRESDEDPQLIARVSVAGCEPLIDSAVTYPECHIRRYEGSSMREYASVTGYCRQIASDLLRQEAELLKLAVEYDASYRALLQLAGNFDLFLGQWRWTVLGSLRDAISIFGQLNRIPCFLSACDESPPPTEPSGSAPSS